jgi:hypothetical protein
MDRITHQSPRQQGYGSTSSLRNDSLKHTRKHERKERGIEPRSKACQALADCPARRGGPSALATWTVRPGAADSPARSRRQSVKDNRTTKDEPGKSDCPRGPGGPSAPDPDRPLLKLGPSANWLQQKPNPKPDRKRRQARTRKHAKNTVPADCPPGTCGLSAPHGQRQEQLDPAGQLLQLITGSPKRYKLMRKEFGDKICVKQGCYTPKLSPPNSLNHWESWIL